jgi:hypothetical protein
MKGDFENHEFSNLVQLSFWCAKKRSSNRPSMDQVVQPLQKFGLVQQGSQPYNANVVDHKDMLTSHIREMYDFFNFEFSNEDI